MKRNTLTFSFGSICWLIAMLLLALPARADRSFAPRFSTNDTGDITMAANTLMRASTNTSQATYASQAAAVQNGTATPAAANQNNNNFMTFVDVDADSTTFNSSQATLTLPSGATVLFAGLYWGADTSAGAAVSTPSSPPFVVAGAVAPNASLRNQVKFSTPLASSTSITASVTDAGASQTTRYQCFANVTSMVQAAGSGTYTVANVQAGTGADRYAVWALVVVYRAPGLPPRNLVVFDGLASIAQATPATISISGFTTPPFGSVNVKLGVVAYEGDLSLTGDQLKFNNVDVTDALNPVGNTFNSTIGTLGTRVTTKNPDYPNQLGVDADIIQLANSGNTVLANNATSATLNFTSSGDVYFPGVLTTAIDLYAPQITAPKVGVDLNGNELNPGDEIEYTITVNNAGGDNAGSLVLTDPIPTGSTYVPGSLRVTGVNQGNKTDAAGDDQAEFDSANNRIVARLGTGANATNGGSLAIGATTAVIFRVRVNNTTPNGAQIYNQSMLSYTSLATGVALASASTAATVTVRYEVAGKVFSDIGTGGGTANDGVLNGGELGIGGVTVRLTDASGSTEYASTTTSASGDYRLVIPVSVPAGTQLKIVETNRPNYFTTGGVPGTTGGSYTRATDTVAFTLGAGNPAGGAAYGNVNFGDVPSNIFTTDGQQSGLPGTIVVYPHTFIAGSAGSVTFVTANVPSPANADWQRVLIRDTNGNAQIDAGELQITGPISLAAGEKLNILVKEFIPVSAALGAKDAVTITANFTYTGATPALSTTATRNDVTTVGTPTTSGLALVKSVNQATALPGQTLTYTLSFRNNSSEPLSNVVIYDTTPAFSTFASAITGPVPAGLGQLTLISPAVGASGSIRWTFAGKLAPGETGIVSFSVKLDQ